LKSAGRVRLGAVIAALVHPALFLTLALLAARVDRQNAAAGIRTYGAGTPLFFAIPGVFVYLATLPYVLRPSQQFGAGDMVRYAVWSAVVCPVLCLFTFLAVSSMPLGRLPWSEEIFFVALPFVPAAAGVYVAYRVACASRNQRLVRSGVSPQPVTPLAS
jgi:hypothetical protein